MNFPINEEEREMLLNILRDELSEIRVEIRRAETPAFKEDLRAERDILEAMTRRLELEVGSRAA